jgi:hypothetical protein
VKKQFTLAPIPYVNYFLPIGQVDVELIFFV